MKRLERLTAILSFLQSKSYTIISEIESKFGISERTAYRHHLLQPVMALDRLLPEAGRLSGFLHFAHPTFTNNWRAIPAKTPVIEWLY